MRNIKSTLHYLEKKLRGTQKTCVTIALGLCDTPEQEKAEKDRVIATYEKEHGRANLYVIARRYAKCKSGIVSAVQY